MKKQTLMSLAFVAVVLIGGEYWYFSTSQPLSLTEQDFSWEGNNLVVKGNLNKSFPIGNLFLYTCKTAPKSAERLTQVSTTLSCEANTKNDTVDGTYEGAVFKEGNMYVFKERVVSGTDKPDFRKLFEVK